MPSGNIFILLNFLLVFLVGIFYLLFKNWEFTSQYEKDEKDYKMACEELYKAIKENNTSFGSPLYKYLFTKLTLEGVASWSSWGKSVRMFRVFKEIILWSLGIILLLSSVLWIFALYMESSGIKMANIISVVFSFYLIFVLFLWVVNIVHCKSLFTERNNENILTPTIEMLTNDKAVPDHSLVLLSKLLTKNKS